MLYTKTQAPLVQYGTVFNAIVYCIICWQHIDQVEFDSQHACPAQTSSSESWTLPLTHQSTGWQAALAWLQYKLCDCGLTSLLDDKLRWLGWSTSCVQRCLQHKALQYMTDCCIHISDIARRQHLRSASCHQLFIPPTIMPSVWLAYQQQQQQPATYQTTSEMRQVLSTVFVWIFFFSFTSIQSTLEALQWCAV